MLTFPHRDTWLHRVNPSLKLLVFAALFVAVILIHNPNVLGCFTLLLLALLCGWTGHPWRRLLLYMSPFLLIFISSSTGMMLFGSGTTTWFRMGPVHMTEESFYRGIHLGFRSLAMAATGLLFSLTTRPVALFYSLIQQFRLSPKYAYSFLAGFRIVPIVFDEFLARRHALKIRGGSRHKGLRRMYDTLQLYAIPLLAQSIRRAQRISVAMQAKRFLVESERTYFYAIRYSWYDAAFVLVIAGMYVASLRLGLAWPALDVTDVR